MQIPIFDFGEARVRKAGETYMQAVNRLIEKAVNVRSEAREAYRNYRSGYDLAGHYRREVLPLRKIISDETLLRYNAMQIDVFALLAEARQRINVTRSGDRSAARILARLCRSRHSGDRRRRGRIGRRDDKDHGRRFRRRRRTLRTSG